LGRRAVSVPLRACPEPSRFTAPDAGMVSGGRDPDGTVDGELDLEPSQAPAAAAPRLRLTAAGAGVPERGPCFLQRRAASRCGPAQAAVADGRAPPAPAAGAPAWPAAIRPGALAAGVAGAGGAAAAGAWAAGTILAAVTLALGLCVVLECAGAAALIARTVRRLGTGGT